MKSIKINGVALSNYKLITRYSFDLITIYNKIYEITDEKPEIDLSKELKEGVHYIYIDNTGLDYASYSITFEDGNAVIRGSYTSAKTAADIFVKMLAEKTELTSADNVCDKMEVAPLYTKEQLRTVLTEVYNNPNACIIGEEAIPFVNNALNRFKEATGKAPGMIGIDLTPYGLDMVTASAEDWSKQLCEVVEFCRAGGIIHVSTHFTNPSGNIPEGPWQHCRGQLGYVDTDEGYEDAFHQLVTKGTEYNTNFMKELEVHGKFLKVLKDNCVPVVYRPLHEMTGYWFWWHVGQNGHYIRSKYYTDLWKYVYNYFVDELGLDNMLWAYAPDISDNNDNIPSKGAIMSSMYCYPGDEYTDIVGVDWYTGKKGALEIRKGNSYLNVVNQTGKIGAITEFGPRHSINTHNLKQKTGEDIPQVDLYNSMDLYGELMQLKDEGYTFSYLLTWINTWSIPNLGKGDELMATDYAFGLDKVAELFKKLG